MAEPAAPVTTAPRPPYLTAALAAVGVWCIYVLTLAPSTAFWDTSEYIATAHIVGIPHPPGNPLFVLMAKTWSLLLAPLGLSVAVRINLFAATTSAAASGFLFLVAHRVLSALSEDGGFAKVGAGVTMLVGATAFTVWNQSNVNEKVYTLSVLIIAAVTWLAVLWRDRRDEPGSGRYLLWAIFLLAIGSTNHQMSLLPAPALALLVLLSGPLRLLRWNFVGRAALLFALGLSFNFVLPVRAAQDPVINEGEPSCESFVGAAAAVYAHALPGGLGNGLPQCRPLADNLARVQYQTPPITQRQSPFRAQLTMYWQYFDWQWSRGMDPSGTPSNVRLPFSLLFLGLGALGLWAAWKADRAVFTCLATLAATLTLGLVVFLNFRYGYSLSPEVTQAGMHEVRERDYFFVAGFLIWGFLAGLGLAWAWNTLAGSVGGARRYLIASPVLVIAVAPLVLNWGWASRAGDYAARDFAYDLLMSVEPYGVLFTSGDNDTFPLWYLQEVEGIRRDVTVIVGQYLLTTWYPEQLQRLTEPENQRPFDAALVPGLYDETPPPTSSILAVPADQLEQVGNARLQESMAVPFPALVVSYPAGTVLDRRQQIALRIIHDSIAERPIFFSSPGGLLSQLGLDRWGVRHGLTVKLDIRDLAAEPAEGLVDANTDFGESWFDVPQSLRLFDEVYRYRGLRDRAVWADRASLNIPAQYYLLGLQLAAAAQAAGLGDDVVGRLQNDAVGFALVAQGGTRGTPTATP